MFELGEFNTLVLDERYQHVKFGPTATGEWPEITEWGANEWDVLVAIVSRAGGYPEASVLRYARRRVVIHRGVVFRIRERFRKHPGIPRQHADSVIITNHNTSAVFLNPGITARFFPQRQHDAPTVREAHAFDTMLHSITRAALELFGQPGLDRAISLLPDDAREATVETKHLPGRWIPVRYLTNWMRAIHGGPAGLAKDAFEEFVRRVELYRLLPHFVDYVRCRAARLADIRQMWRTCYDSGDFEAVLSPKNDLLKLRLWNHPYCHNERSGGVFALCWQFLAEHLHAKEPRVEFCAVEPATGALRISIAGSFPS